MRLRRTLELPQGPLPRHPYRNTAILHLVLACAIVLVAWATGGALGRAVVVASGFFVLATAYSWWRWRQRFEAERRQQERHEPLPGRASGRRSR